MADLDATQDTKEYYLDIPQKSEAFYLKGSNALGWGMQNRLIMDTFRVRPLDLSELM